MSFAKQEQGAALTNDSRLEKIYFTGSKDYRDHHEQYKQAVIAKCGKAACTIVTSQPA